MATYGITGSSPLAQPSISMNAALRNFIQQNWDINITTPYDPPASEMGFTTNWWDDYGDIDIAFRISSSDYMKISTDHRLEDCTDTVDIHVFVRESGDDEPLAIQKIITRIKELINNNKTTAIPNARVYLTSFMPVPEEQSGDKMYKPTADIWHYVASCDVKYNMVSTV